MFREALYVSQHPISER